RAGRAARAAVFPANPYPSIILICGAARGGGAPARVGDCCGGGPKCILVTDRSTRPGEKAHGHDSQVSCEEVRGKTTRWCRKKSTKAIRSEGCCGQARQICKQETGGEAASRKEGRGQEANRQEGRSEEGCRKEAARQEGRREKASREEGRCQVRREEAGSQKAGREETSSQEASREEASRQEGGGEASREENRCQEAGQSRGKAESSGQRSSSGQPGAGCPGPAHQSRGGAGTYPGLARRQAGSRAPDPGMAGRRRCHGNSCAQCGGCRRPGSGPGQHHACRRRAAQRRGQARRLICGATGRGHWRFKRQAIT